VLAQTIVSLKGTVESPKGGAVVGFLAFYSYQILADERSAETASTQSVSDPAHDSDNHGMTLSLLPHRRT